MKCAQARRELARALAARAAVSAALGNHLEECGACRSEARAARRVDRALADVRSPSLPVGLDRRLDAAIRGVRPRGSWAPALAAATVVAVVLLAGASLWRRDAVPALPSVAVATPPGPFEPEPAAMPTATETVERTAPAAVERTIAASAPPRATRPAARPRRGEAPVPAPRVARGDEPLRTERMSPAAVEKLFANLPEVTVAMDVPAVMTDFEVGATGRLTAVASLVPPEVIAP